MTSSQTLGVGCLVLNQTCGKLAKPLQKEIERLVSINGPEWTCARLKAIYTASLNLADGKPGEARSIYQKNSISYNKRTLLPKGRIGVLVGDFLRAKRPSVIRRKAAALRIYTQMALPNGSDPTKRQIQKALPAIMEPCPVEFKEEPSKRQISNGVVRGSCVTIRLPHGTPGRRELMHQSVSVEPGTRARIFLNSLSANFYFGEDRDLQLADNPTAVSDLCQIMLQRRLDYSSYKAKPIRNDEDGADKLRANSYYYSPVVPKSDLRKRPKEFETDAQWKDTYKDQSFWKIPYARMVLSFNSTEWVPDSLDGSTRCAEMRAELRQNGIHDRYAGRIGVMQERGYKARVVAQPSAWLQLACQPYHKRLAQACYTMFPKECDTEDQAAGAYDARDHIYGGNRVYCVDMSSATDRFPREITLRLIRQLGYPQFADAVEEISSKPWECSFSPSGETHYGCGQPMGLYGSFPAFALTNLCLCDASVSLATSKELIADRYKLGEEWTSSLKPFPSGVFFHVLGDDVIFSDGRVASAYREMLDTLGVKVSTDKCFDGGHIAEYAGFIIRKSGDTVTAYRPYKYPGGKHINNPLEFVHAVGASVCSIPRRTTFWARVFRAYSASAGMRDITLAPLVLDDDTVFGFANRASASDLVSLSKHLGYLLEEQGFTPEEMRKYLPCLEGDSRINSRPLIDEARPDQLHRYDPVSYIPKRDDRPKDFGATARRISQDPLMQDYFRQEKELGEPVPVIRRSPILREAKTLTPDPSNTGSTTPGQIDSISTDESMALDGQQSDELTRVPTTNGQLDVRVSDCHTLVKQESHRSPCDYGALLRSDPAFQLRSDPTDKSRILDL